MMTVSYRNPRCLCSVEIRCETDLSGIAVARIGRIERRGSILQDGVLGVYRKSIDAQTVATRAIWQRQH